MNSDTSTIRYTRNTATLKHKKSSGLSLYGGSDPTTKKNIFHVLAESPNHENNQIFKSMISNLKQAGGDPAVVLNHQDKLGNTPAHYALARDNHDLVDFIVQNGGNTNIANQAGVMIGKVLNKVHSAIESVGKHTLNVGSLIYNYITKNNKPMEGYELATRTTSPKLEKRLSKTNIQPTALEEEVPASVPAPVPAPVPTAPAPIDVQNGGVQSNPTNTEDLKSAIQQAIASMNPQKGGNMKMDYGIRKINSLVSESTPMTGGRKSKSSKWSVTSDKMNDSEILSSDNFNDIAQLAKIARKMSRETTEETKKSMKSKDKKEEKKHKEKEHKKEKKHHSETSSLSPRKMEKNEAHTNSVKKIMDLLGINESKANAYKSYIWSKIKEKHPNESSYDKSKKLLEKASDLKYLKSLNEKEIDAKEKAIKEHLKTKASSNSSMTTSSS